MKGGYPYPIETLRHWYVAPIGGQSQDLEPDQIGLNEEALARNTDLVPFQDRVTLSLLEGDARPLFARSYFEVVALDGSSADALSKSPKGEVVLPAEGACPKCRASVPFKVGEMVVLNGVLTQRWPKSFGKGPL